jgi:hypothetical protein
MGEKIKIRNYNPKSDYKGLFNLYTVDNNFGGQFDEARDSEHKINVLIKAKEDAILVAEINETLVGTVTLFEDGRTAWLFRFAVQKEFEEQITKKLTLKALEILKGRGHSQVLVYAPHGDKHFEERYKKAGFKKGNDYTSYWQDID